jgi:hypothetical protein
LVATRTDPPDCAGPSIGATNNTASCRQRSCGGHVRPIAIIVVPFVLFGAQQDRPSGAWWDEAGDPAVWLTVLLCRPQSCSESSLWRKPAQRPGEPRVVALTFELHADPTPLTVMLDSGTARQISQALQHYADQADQRDQGDRN